MSALNYAYLRVALSFGRHPRLALCVLLAVAMSVQPAHAAVCGSVVGFSGFTALLGAVAHFLTGSFARAGIIIAIVIFGALLLFGELKGIFGTGIKILFGGSLILGAVQWAGLFNGFGGAAGACSYIQSGF
ncbi:MAG: TrbC/VirB2 family protein [Sinobacteraceae bacterium]|nr:TrbC/VirB2 family protein [Nevskiaceae bacterium]